MPHQPESMPFHRLVDLWTHSENALELQRVRQLWPELADAMDSLVGVSSRVITGDRRPSVATLAPPVPRSAPPRHSATASAHDGTEPSRVPLAPGTPVQDELPLEGK